MEFLKALLQNPNIPSEVNSIFSIIVILGLVFLFFNFITHFYKYYWEKIRPSLKQEKELEKIKIESEAKEKAREEAERNAPRRNYASELQENGGMTSDKAFAMVLDTYKTISNMSQEYAGKYARKEDVRNMEVELDALRSEVSNLKGQLGMK